MIAVLMVWVVLSGIPSLAASSMVVAAVVSVDRFQPGELDPHGLHNATPAYGGADAHRDRTQQDDAQRHGKLRNRTAQQQHQGEGANELAAIITASSLPCLQ